jgi:arylsulfatase A-like enzyme
MRSKHLTALFLAVSAAVQGAQKPNILYIMSDDHTAHAIGSYRGRLATLNPTPTIDRLANEGILFENAFCCNSICAPSRASVITGQYPHKNGAFDLSGAIPVGMRQGIARRGVCTAQARKFS